MMTKKTSEGGNTSLFSLVAEKKNREEEKNKRRLSAIPYIPKECISNILLRLPLESIQRSRFVCKPWYKIIYSPFFIDAHLRRTENVLIFLRTEAKQSYSTPSLSQERSNTFSVEDRVFDLQSVHVFHRPIISPSSKFYMEFVAIKDGKPMIGKFNLTCLGKIRATCNGLILLDNTMRKGGLIVMNPVTRDLSMLPLGTLLPHKESYGLSFCKSNGKFKLVHLFMDEMNFVGCEILTQGTKSWRAINGPAFGLFSGFGYKPVSAIGALHWIPHFDHSEYILSMTMDDEKFHKIVLPKRSRTNDRLVEMGEFLCFVTHEGENRIDVWILTNVVEEDWTKKYSINGGCINNMDRMVPLYCSRFGSEMIFMGKRGSFFAYDFQIQVMEKIDVEKGHAPLNGSYLPHVNSLVSWRINTGECIDG